MFADWSSLVVEVILNSTGSSQQSDQLIQIKYSKGLRQKYNIQINLKIYIVQLAKMSKKDCYVFDSVGNCIIESPHSWQISFYPLHLEYFS